MKAAILTYHRVGECGNSRDELRQCVPTGNFVRQMDVLSSLGYETVSLDTIATFVKGGLPVPRRRIAITFDDAYTDVATFAVPILEEYGFKATVFVPTGLAGSSSSAWQREKPQLAAPILGWEQIAELSRRGFDVASHTVTHPDLTTLPPDRLAEELSASKGELEKRIGRPVSGLCYPYGRFNGEVLAAARQAGYLWACTTAFGRNTGGTDPYALRRIAVSGWNGVLKFLYKLYLKGL